MSKIHTYPKIFPVGSDFIPDLFKGNVQIEEKIDGSQFAFGITKEGELVVRSKGKEMQTDNPEKMFSHAVEYVLSIEQTLRKMQAERYPQGIFYYGEYLGGPHHNILSYERIPKNHIMIFGVMEGESFVKEYSRMTELAAEIDLEVVPLIYSGEIASFEDLNKYMDTDSGLGKEKSEGIVVKNYLSPAILGNMVIPSMGKFVREDFKERHATDWGPRFSHSSKIDLFLASFRTEARWHKAIQHLKEKGELANEPKDIGILMKEIENDIVEEEKENIKNELYKLYIEQVLRKARAGFPEFYKELLAKRAFE